MDDALDCELVDVKGLFSFPKTNMGTASNKYALENEWIFGRLFPLGWRNSTIWQVQAVPKEYNCWPKLLPWLKWLYCVVGV